MIIVFVSIWRLSHDIYHPSHLYYYENLNRVCKKLATTHYPEIQHQCCGFRQGWISLDDWERL